MISLFIKFPPFLLNFLEQFSGHLLKDLNSQVFFLVFCLFGGRGRMLFIEPYGNAIKAVDLVFFEKDRLWAPGCKAPFWSLRK